MRLNAGRTFVLGIGFFTVTLVWSQYNTFLPLLYADYISSTVLIGALMTLDNVLAITLQPYFGTLSDRTVTRFGRRMPFLLIGIPVAAVSFALIPTGYRLGLFALVAIALVMNLAMAVFRSPVVALMPDVTPAPLRSQANGIINFMGGLGAVVAFGAAPVLFGMDRSLPFLATGGLMVVVMIVVWAGIKEPRHYEPSEVHPPRGVFATIAELASARSGPDRSAYLLFWTILVWFLGFQAVETFMSLYGREHLGLGDTAAGQNLFFFAGCFLLFAIPAGFIGGRFGRKRTIRAGLWGLVVVLGILMLIHDLWTFRALLMAGGICWALVNINSYPMVAELAGAHRTGAFTGLYYLFSNLAAIISPLVFGALIDLLDWPVLFAGAALSMIVAIRLLRGVEHGESTPAEADLATGS